MYSKFERGLNSKTYSDCHAHLGLFPSEEVREMGRKGKIQGIGLVVSPSINLTSSYRNLELAQNFDIVYPAVGLHPWFIGQVDREEKEKVLDQVRNQDFIAISEVGLDFKHNPQFRQEQISFFKRCLELGEDLGKPLIIHLLGAFKEAIEIIKNFSNVEGIVHCFGGNLKNAQELVDLDFLPSIGNAVLTDSFPSLQGIIDNLGIEEMVIDTDTLPGTYQISDAIDIADFIAERKNLSSREVGKVTTQNLKSLLSGV